MNQESYKSEDALCTAFWKRMKTLDLWSYFTSKTIIFHVPNEVPQPKGFKNLFKRYGARMKRIGKVAGVLDYCIIYDGNRVAFLEAKKKGEGLIPSQKIFTKRLTEVGVPWGVFTTVREAEAKLIEWGIIKE